MGKVTTARPKFAQYIAALHASWKEKRAFAKARREQSSQFRRSQKVARRQAAASRRHIAGMLADMPTPMHRAQREKHWLKKQLKREKRRVFWKLFWEKMQFRKNRRQDKRAFNRICRQNLWAALGAPPTEQKAAAPRKRRIYNLSLRLAFMWYMLVWLLLGTLLIILIVSVIDEIRVDIYYGDYMEGYHIQSIYPNEYRVFIPDSYEYNISLSQVPDSDKITIWFTASESRYLVMLDILSAITIPVISVLCIASAGALFYKNRLKKPILILDEASRNIQNNNLDFHVSYPRKDEMGRLITSFEAMRATLNESNLDTWRQMEERKRLNAAFSHDLRTPLTVLKGNTDMLRTYYPQGKITDEKLLATLQGMSSQIDRLERYVEAMARLQKLEDLPITRQHVPREVFFASLHHTAMLLCRPRGLQLEYIDTCKAPTLFVDPEIVAQVFENLLANAVRYAATTVYIQCRYTPATLSIIVSDDGPGFTPEGLAMAARPFYKAKENSNDTHFGLGLNICTVLCQRHNGSLQLSNRPEGGAQISADFGQAGTVDE